MKDDVAPDPVKIGFFRPVGVIFQAQFIADLFEEFLFGGGVQSWRWQEGRYNGFAVHSYLYRKIAVYAGLIQQDCGISNS